MPYPGWPVPGQAVSSGELIPYIVSSSSVISLDSGRLLFSLIDPASNVVSSPTVAVDAEFYDLTADPSIPVFTRAATFMDPAASGRGLYRVSTAFTCAGTWGMRLHVQGPAGAEAVETSVIFDVIARGSVPSIGSSAPRSGSPTARSEEQMRSISTDDDPDPRFYRSSIAEAVASGKPSVILFATPQFCRSAACGPSLDRVKALADQFEDRVTFIHVEPFELVSSPSGLQPALDEAGQLQPVQAALDWGLPTEPYLFVVDADGRVSASFEGLFDDDELAQAIMATTGS